MRGLALFYWARLLLLAEDSEWCFSFTAAAPPPAVTANETWRPSSPERVSLPSSDPGTRLFSAVRSLNDSVIMSPPEKFTNGELPELDEAGYASLILRTVKSDSKVAEPVYERIKGERSMSREYVFMPKPRLSAFLTLYRRTIVTNLSTNYQWQCGSAIRLEIWAVIAQKISMYDGMTKRNLMDGLRLNNPIA